MHNLLDTLSDLLAINKAFRESSSCKIDLIRIGMGHQKKMVYLDAVDSFTDDFIS